MPQNQARWAHQKILFVSGKGGVGKSLVAAAIALEQSRAGRRVLLAEIGDSSYYKDFFHLPEVGHQPIRLEEGFDIALWSGESCLREYVLHYLKLERLYHVFFENKIMRSLINVAPGLNEVAILGKITSGIRRVGPPLDYDLIVVDCYATGHALALLQAPRGMMEAIKFGPMGQQSRDMRAVLEDPQVCGYAVVTLLEEMPVVEALEYRAGLNKELGVEAEIIANKIMALPAEEAELETLARGSDPGMAEFAAFLSGVGNRQTQLMETLRATAATITRVPLIFSNQAKALVEASADALTR